MSDGPHRSLPMRRAWKMLAERADNPNFTSEQVDEVVKQALADDWRAEVPPSLLETVAAMLGANKQSDLFVGDVTELARIRAGCDSPMAAAFVDAFGDALAEGLRGSAVIRQAVEAALLDRALRESRAVEEHYLRKSAQARGSNVRARLEAAVERAALGDLARVISEGASTARRFAPAKRDGLDEGVPL